MKKSAKLTSLLLATLLTVSATSCAKQSDSSSGNSSAASSGESSSSSAASESITFPLKEPIEITAMIRDFNRERTLKIDQELEKRTNIKIDWNVVPAADYTTILNIKLNSGELPDMIQTGKTACDKFGSQGIFADLYPYFDQMPNLQKWIEKVPAIKNDLLTQDNKYYGLTTFNTRGQVPRMSIYRKDLFEKEGLAEPTTIDELYNSLVTLKGKYPDSTPIVSRWGSSNLIGAVASLYHTSTDYFLNNDTLVYEFGPSTENFKKAIATLAKFYKAGLIDPEFATIADEQFIERITSGKAFFMFSEYTCCLNTEAQGDWIGNGQKTNSDFQLEAIAPVSTEIGKGLMTTQYPSSGGGFAVSVSAKSEYIDEIVAYLDYQLSDEIIELTNWGIEGETFKTENGQKEFLIDDKQRKDWGLDGRSGMWVPLDQDASDKTLDPADKEIVEKWNTKASEFSLWNPLKKVSFTEVESEQKSTIMTPLNTYEDEQLINFITGKLNMDADWDKFQKELKNMGYETILKMYQDKYAALPDDQKGLDTGLGLE